MSGDWEVRFECFFAPNVDQPKGVLCKVWVNDDVVATGFSDDLTPGGYSEAAKHCLLLLQKHISICNAAARLLEER